MPEQWYRCRVVHSSHGLDTWWRDLGCQITPHNYIIYRLVGIFVVLYLNVSGIYIYIYLDILIYRCVNSCICMTSCTSHELLYNIQYLYTYTHLTYNLCNMPIRKAPTPADDDWKFHVCQEFTFCPGLGHEGLVCIWLLIAWVVESMQLSQVRHLPQHLWLMLRLPQWRLRCPQLRLRCPGGPGLAVFLGFLWFLGAGCKQKI